jgi:hypothetical protein
MINEDTLKYQLIRGLDIQFIDSSNQVINIKQPKIKNIDEIGLLSYLTYTYIFRITKEHLNYYDEIKDKLDGKSLFESIFIHDEYHRQKTDFNMLDSYIIKLICSLAFFLGINDFNKIGFSEDENSIEVNDFKEKDGQIIKVPMFRLNSNNFDEFCELIRIITYTDLLEKENKIKKVLYSDKNVQKMYEDLLKQYEQEEDKKQEENKLTISDVIGAICINDKTKYNYSNIDSLTIWQMFYQFNSMFEKENIEITKSQFTSGNFSFDKTPDLNWLNKIKVKLPKKL